MNRAETLIRSSSKQNCPRMIEHENRTSELVLDVSTLAWLGFVFHQIVFSTVFLDCVFSLFL